ncbi:sigma-54 interaction domain-containing protein [Nitrospira sp. Kam-Ns4a]
MADTINDGGPSRGPDTGEAGPAPLTISSRLIGDSPIMHRLRAQIQAVARSDCAVVIYGESGVGKELVAREIHAHSHRRQGPFITINCGAIPETLAEAELFGYERGAFTGAVTGKPGKFELAHGGTLFLDEVGDLSLAMQVKFLRVLQDSVIDRIGSRQPKPVDVRILAATHRSLEALCRAGLFRWDLYYRLHVLPLVVPPLRQHPEDIPALVASQMTKLIATLGQSVTISAAALAALQRYPWPGNVRELENVVERTVVYKGRGVIEPADLAFSSAPPGPPPASPAPGASARQEPLLELGPGFCLADTLAATEARWIASALRQTHGIIAHAARLLGINRTTLIERMRRLKRRYGPQWTTWSEASTHDDATAPSERQEVSGDQVPATIWRLPVWPLPADQRSGPGGSRGRPRRAPNGAATAPIA